MRAFCLLLCALLVCVWSQDLNTADLDVNMESDFANLEENLDYYEENDQVVDDEEGNEEVVDEATIAANCTKLRQKCIGHHAGSTCKIAQMRFNCLKKLKCLTPKDISACHVFQTLCADLKCNAPKPPKPPMGRCNETEWAVCAGMLNSTSACQGLQNNMTCARKAHCFSHAVAAGCQKFKAKFMCSHVNCKSRPGPPKPPMNRCNETAWAVCAGMMNSTGACQGLQNNMTCAKKAHCYTKTVAEHCRTIKAELFCLSVNCSMPMSGCGTMKTESTCNMRKGCQWNAMENRCVAHKMGPQCNTKTTWVSCASTKGCVWDSSTATCTRKLPPSQICKQYTTLIHCETNSECTWKDAMCVAKHKMTGCATHMSESSCEATKNCQWSTKTATCDMKKKPQTMCSNKEYSKIDICLRGKYGGKPSWQIPICEQVAAKIACAKMQSQSCVNAYMSICKLEKPDCPNLQC